MSFASVARPGLQLASCRHANDAEAAAALEEQGKTVVAVLRDDERVARAYRLGRRSRAEAAPLVGSLSRQGIVTVVMLTGDNERVARSIARQDRHHRVYAGSCRTEKAQIVQAVAARARYCRYGRRWHQRRAGAGGLRISASLWAAPATDVALETADVVLMGDKLERLVDAFRLSRRASQVVWQNIALFARGDRPADSRCVSRLELPLPSASWVTKAAPSSSCSMACSACSYCPSLRQAGTSVNALLAPKLRTLPLCKKILQLEPLVLPR